MFVWLVICAFNRTWLQWANYKRLFDSDYLRVFLVVVAVLFFLYFLQLWIKYVDWNEKCVKNKRSCLSIGFTWFDGNTIFIHKMDYRISCGLIWALVLVASTCSAYIDEQDMRGEWQLFFFIRNLSHSWLFFIFSIRNFLFFSSSRDGKSFSCI